MTDIKVSLSHFYSERHQQLSIEQRDFWFGMPKKSLEEHIIPGSPMYKNCSPGKPEIASVGNFSWYQFNFGETISSLIIISFILVLYINSPMYNAKTNIQITEIQISRQSYGLCTIRQLDIMTWGRFKNTFELLNLRALKFSPVIKIHFFQCKGKIFCVEFQRYRLKFHKNILPIHWTVCFYTTLKLSELLHLRAHTRLCIVITYDTCDAWSVACFFETLGIGVRTRSIFMGISNFCF